MGTCEVCGNTYRKTFNVHMDDQSYVFDSFECAIHLLAPTCINCGVRVIGHGLELDGMIFCCEHCSRQVVGESKLEDG